MLDKYTKKILQHNDKYIIFYSNWCKFSKQALNLLSDHKLNFKGYQIDKINGDINILLACLKKTHDLTYFNVNHNTRPIIFKNSKFIGGYMELQKSLE
jgi:glutaredoxin